VNRWNAYGARANFGKKVAPYLWANSFLLGLDVTTKAD
jgi:hypothetical protein